MKLIFTRENVKDDNAIIVSDINIVDILAEDAEATEIIVDEFLNQFNYRDAGQVLNKILSKLRLGGHITIMQLDIEILSYHLSRGMIDVEQFNAAAFTGPCRSLMSLEIVETLLKNGGVKITSKYFKNDIAIVKGVRNV